MVDAKSRARVERIIRGDFRPDDLTGLFLYARDHCDGRESVTDIGDFVAHHSERDKGIVTRSTREWFLTIRFNGYFYPDKPRDLDRMPPPTKDFLEISVNRLDGEILRKETKLRRSEAYKLMQKIIERLTKNADGTWFITNVTPIERRLLECACWYIVSRPAFEADRLCDDFIETLKSNGLITKEEIKQHKKDLDILVKLYAVAAMHNCIVQIGDGTTTQLKARPEIEAKRIEVSAGVPFSGNPAILIASSMFTVDLDPTVHCHPELISSREWNFEIEVAPDKKLSPLR
jgi:hypothetical protein